jgi:hypothetical protein
MYMSRWNPIRPLYAAMVVLFSGLANLTRQPQLAAEPSVGRRSAARRTISPITT